MRRIRISRRIPIAILILVVALVAARIALPVVLESYINKTLDGIKGYAGHVEDVDVALWRGAYSIEGLKLVKTDGKVREPFFAARDVEIALDWAALIRGRLKSRIQFDRPEMHFVFRKSGETSPDKVDESWQRQLQQLYPFEINHFAIVNGMIRYKDETKTPKTTVHASNLDLTATNISNTERSKSRLPSTLDFKGTLLNSAQMHARAKFNMLTEPTELDFNGSLRDLDLTKLNDFAKAYGNFDFEKGSMDLAFELAASKTRYNGYVKAVSKGVDILDFSKENKKGDSVGHLLWEGLAGSIIDIFENQGRDQFAVRVPIGGSRKELSVDSWATLESILKNAFVKAYKPDLEDSVEFNDATRSATTEEGSTDDGDTKD